MTSRNMRVVMMAGGTGGHVFPALSIAEELHNRGASISWLGTAKGIESRLVPEAGYPLHLLTIEGIRGRGLGALLRAPFKLIQAVLQARGFIKQDNANVVVGLGGFASGPGGLAARLMGIPLLIHEQNAAAGTTNRALSRLATRVYEAFPGSLSGAIQVGNPVRSSIAQVAPAELAGEGRRLRVLVLGGSLGALALNELLPEALQKLPAEQRPEVIHQTGDKHLAATQRGYESAAVDAKVTSFIKDMAEVYQWADLVICRSGALTVSELAAAGRASFLVPFPHAIDDHQTKNAHWLANNNAAVVKQQSELQAEDLTRFITEMNQDRLRLLAMSQAARNLGSNDAAQKVADGCEEVSK